MVATTPSLSKEVGDSAMDANRVCTNGGSGKNKYSHHTPIIVSKVYT